MTTWSVHSVQPNPRQPASAVTIHPDDATVREGIYDLARMMTASQWAELRIRVQCYDQHAAEHGYESAEPCRVAMDDVLDDVCRGNGHDLTGLVRVRVGVEELGLLVDALYDAALLDKAAS